MNDLKQKPSACKTCSGQNMRRLSRHGFLENSILSRLGYYPWECATCRRRRYLPERGSSQPKGV